MVVLPSLNLLGEIIFLYWSISRSWFRVLLLLSFVIPYQTVHSSSLLKDRY
jgi:hypothetical protein